MHIRTSIVCLPVQNLEKSLTFYKNVFGLPDIQIEEGMITVELPNLSIFLMESAVFETYSQKAGRSVHLTKDHVGSIISCAVMSKDDVDTALENAEKYGGSAPVKAKNDELYGGYMGYISDPDGQLWELVFPMQKQ